MTALKDLALEVAKQVLGDKDPAPSDVFDEELLPFGVAPGNNKFGLTACPFCAKEATLTGRNALPQAFLFRDRLSAEEYMISGLCQACQDKTFGGDDGA